MGGEGIIPSILKFKFSDFQLNFKKGLMLREPGSHYECKRSHTLLKVKTFRDEEALVTGHERGEGTQIRTQSVSPTTNLNNSHSHTTPLFNLIIQEGVRV